MSAPVPRRYVDLASLLLTAEGASGLTVRVLPGYCTAWDDVTRENTVSAGATEYTDLPSMFPSLMAVGPIVLVAVGEASPFILGRIYNAEPA